MKLKKGDTVYILQGKDRAKTGAVVKVFPKEEKIIVENINMQVRHKRPRREGRKGERIQVAMPIHSSNVLIVCSSCKKPTRIAIKKSEEGDKKTRVCKKCGTQI